MTSAALVLLPSVLAVIRSEGLRAWRSLRRFGFEPADLHQEFMADCLGRVKNYDPARSSPATFAHHSCRHGHFS